MNTFNFRYKSTFFTIQPYNRNALQLNNVKKENRA